MLTKLEELTQLMAQVPDVRSLVRLIHLVETAPGPTLYPLYRTIDLGIDEIQETIDTVEVMNIINNRNCADTIASDFGEIDDTYDRLRHRSTLWKIVGKVTCPQSMVQLE